MKQSLLFVPSLAPGNHSPLSISVGFPILDVSYGWTHTAHGLLFSGFTHLESGAYSTSFLCRTEEYSTVWTHQFARPFVSWWTFALLPCFGHCK